MSAFIQKLTDDKKKARELKFTIYLITDIKELNSTYSALILNRKNERVLLKDTVDNCYIQAYIKGLVKSIYHILNNTDKKFHKYIIITIKSDNSFFNTLLNEWIKIWGDFVNRPYEEDLRELNKLLSNIRYKTSSLDTDENVWHLKHSKGISETRNKELTKTIDKLREIKI